MSDVASFPEHLIAWFPERSGGFYVSCRYPDLDCWCHWSTSGDEREIEEAARRHVEEHSKRCPHREAVPVESGGEIVSALCPGCDLQLPASFLSCDHGGVEDPHWCDNCGVLYWGWST